MDRSLPWEDWVDGFCAGYEDAKRMTVTLPCAMPYLCFEGAVTALEENRTLHPETFDEALRALDIMTMQNETAFYARLFFSRVQGILSYSKSGSGKRESTTSF